MKELSLNILDIAQNSLRAGASEVEIEIAENSAGNLFSMRITDDGCGMDKETVARVIDPFYTSRNTRKVGLGIPFLKMAAEMTGGYLNLDSVPGEGTTIFASFNSGSIDFIPLGDIVSTVCSLIQGSPNVDFVFRHTIDGQEIILNTKEIRAVLGEEISLAEFEVLAWITENLKQEYDNITK